MKADKKLTVVMCCHLFDWRYAAPSSGDFRRRPSPPKTRGLSWRNGFLLALQRGLRWAIPCQRSEKKGQCQKDDFFDEMWKIIRQIDDFGRFLNNFCNFGVFLAKNQKFKKHCFEKVNIERIFYLKRLNNLFQIADISFL